MNEKDLFEKGCFLPCWTEDDAGQELTSVSEVYTRQNKDLQTLLNELAEIKERIQDIQARQWNLAKLIHFHENNFVNN